MEVDELATIVESGFKDLRTRIDETNARIDHSRLKERVTNMNGRVEEVRTRHMSVDLHLMRIDTFGGRITAVEDEVHKANAQIWAIYEKLEELGELIHAWAKNSTVPNSDLNGRQVPPTIARNSSSLSTGTPSDFAFSSFDPAASPATR